MERTDYRAVIATIGTFDGLHRGHRAVLGMLAQEARTRGLEPLVMTFDRHPLEIIAPGRAPRLIMAPDRRDSLIREAGLPVERLRFDDSVRRMTAAEWMGHLARDRGLKVLVLGYDNTFGCDGVALDADDYRRLGREAGIEVLVAPVIPGCSSSAVRRAVADADFDKAAGILGRRFSVRGEVVHGRELGRTIGVPTANVEVDARLLLPPRGVYAVSVPVGGREWKGVANIGFAPTVTDGSASGLEVHIDGFDGDLYGREIEVAFHRRLRDELKFPSIGALREQIEADLAAMRACKD